jgi:Protein of unknown function (DUF2384)
LTDCDRERTFIKTPDPQHEITLDQPLLTTQMSAVLHPDTSKPTAVNLNTGAAAEAALRTFWRLAEAWKLNIAEQLTLLGVARTTLYQWKQGKVGPLDRHVLERMSYLFGIYAALQILLPVSERANEWIRKPNTAPFLGGKSALERMLAGQVGDLFVVRHYLDAERGGKA